MKSSDDMTHQLAIIYIFQLLCHNSNFCKCLPCIFIFHESEEINFLVNINHLEQRKQFGLRHWDAAVDAASMARTAFSPHS